MPLTSGTKLGSYEILSLLGKGGMGEVYRARDTKLGREVAIKALPEAFSQDKERLVRLEREARLLASLNHPNVATLHGLEDANGIRFLVMELVEGETLAERIARGPIRLDEALPLFKQIADGLSAAHEKSVIHRDLKPANIKIGLDGKPKILDFGLAKGGFVQDVKSESPTVTRQETETGVVLGTPAYMSPEQARGKTLDKRTDMWSFGCCLYEALTGKTAFHGETVSVTIGKILEREPDWEALPEGAPRWLRSLLRRCLKKDPGRRLHDVADARLEIEEALETPRTDTHETVAVQPLQIWQRPVPTTIIALILLAIGGLTGFILSRPAPAPPGLGRFVLTAPPSEPVSVHVAWRDLAISPDGQRVVYTTGTPPQLYVRALDQLAGARLDGTEEANSPFFSRDGTWVGFASGGELKKVSVLGGPSLTLCALVGGILTGASWGADDIILFGTPSRLGLFRVAAAGGEPEVLTTAEARESHEQPEILPGGKAVLFTIKIGIGTAQKRIALLNLETGEQTELIPRGSQPRYAGTGHIVYANQGTLLAVPFDVARLSVTGDPVPVLEGVEHKVSGSVDFSFSDNGSLVYVPGGVSTGGTLGWVTRDGQMTDVTEGAGIFGSPRLSPEGTRVAVVRIGEDGANIWIRDMERGSDTRLTVEGTINWMPVWTPDGATVSFISNRADASANALYSKPADGSGEAELLVQPGSYPGSWSPDGRTFVYAARGGTSGSTDIWTLPLGGDPAPFQDTPFNERAPLVSPDGHWVAYVSDLAGQRRVYVQPFPEGGRVIPISTSGGTEPVWSRDGRELFYRDGTQLLVVRVVTKPTFIAEKPTVLFEESYATDPVFGGNPNYDVSLDGQRFLMVESTGAGESATVTLVQNWFQELERLVPTGN